MAVFYTKKHIFRKISEENQLVKIREHGKANCSKFLRKSLS